MKIRMTLELTERERSAIAHQTGSSIPANRSDARAWIIKVLDATLAELTAELDAHAEQDVPTATMAGHREHNAHCSRCNQTGGYHDGLPPGQASIR